MGGKKLSARYDAMFSGWVNVTLTAADANEFDAWLNTGGLWSVFEAACDAGLKLTLTRQWNEGVYLASVFQRDTEHVNAGLMVSARSSTAARALAKVLWVCEYKLPGEWPRSQGRPSDSW